ncbi:MAG: hypothetical protein QM796_01240 [Chthoniobacteraceae bacterium]
MKAFIASLLILIAGFITTASAVTYPSFLVTVNGTITYTTGIASSGTTDFSKARTHADLITNQKLYAEFGVQPGDYALIFDLNTFYLEFIPRSASSSLSTIVVFKVTTFTGGSINGSTGIYLSQNVVASSTDADGTYFQNTAGYCISKLFYKPSTLTNFSTAYIKGMDMKVTTGGYTSTSTVKQPPIMLHIVTGKTFTQGT